MQDLFVVFFLEVAFLPSEAYCSESYNACYGGACCYCSCVLAEPGRFDFEGSGCHYRAGAVEEERLESLDGVRSSLRFWYVECEVEAGCWSEYESDELIIEADDDLGGTVLDRES